MLEELNKHHDKCLGKLGLLLYFGKLAAQESHLNTDQADDCAVEFAEKMRLTDRWEQWQLMGFSAAWARKCATNYARNFGASAKSGTSRVIASDGACDIVDAMVDGRYGPEAEALLGETNAEVAAAFNDLTAPQRQVVTMHYSHAMPIPEIATAVRKSPAAVKMLLARACSRMQSYLVRHNFNIDDAMRQFAPPPVEAASGRRKTPTDNF